MARHDRILYIRQIEGYCHYLILRSIKYQYIHVLYIHILQYSVYNLNVTAFSFPESASPISAILGMSNSRRAV